MEAKHLLADLSALRPDSLKIAYIDHTPTHKVASKGTLLLLHGFPQTSHQFRHAAPLLAGHGYRVIIPDYRGAGNSSKTHTDFRKTTMAVDMVALLDYLDIKDPIHLIGHDIGGMIAWPLAARYPERVKSVVWGECPLPGTQMYHEGRREHAVHFFHWIFQSVPDLPEALVEGKERTYVSHFLRKITYNLAAFGEEDVDFYGKAYAEPGAMRCAFGVYRAFEEDARENREWVAERGKCRVPTLVLSGEQSRLRVGAEDMAKEVTEAEMVEVGEVGQAGHYLAEENARGFTERVVEFVGKHV